ncbi:hypothetical protein QJQ45_014240 [Haematococcus lacustris]|nr:hypothetical protein QJQ45_014240 [Haematococcus lacustris]
MRSVRSCYIRGSVVRYIQVSRLSQRRVGCRARAHGTVKLAGAIARHISQLLQCLRDECGMRLHAQLPASAVDVEILHDATRREARGG